jgi:hypothetical protein
MCQTQKPSRSLKEKKSIKYKIERKAITQIKQIKDYGTSPSRPKQSSRAWAAVLHHAAENSTPCNPGPQMVSSLMTNED